MLRNSETIGAILHRRSWTALALLYLAAGCSSLPAEKYTFKNLPQMYVATRRENPQTLELSRLASSTKQSDVIDRGDVVEITISAGLDARETITLPVRVQDNGAVQLPEIGAVQIAGLNEAEAEASIVATSIQRELYNNPSVTVHMKKQRTNRVMVVGAVKKPDIYELPRGNSDLLAALVAAGGLAEDAGTMVEIRNPNSGRGRGPSALPPIAERSEASIDAVGHSTMSPPDGEGPFNTVRINLVSATSEGTGGQMIQDGGVVYVEKRDPEPVFVQGLVRKSDRYEYPVAEELRLLGAISMAGGLSNTMADRVFVVRRKPDNKGTVIIDVKVSDAKRNEQANVLLMPGDVVSVEQTPTTVMVDLFQRLSMGFGATLPLTALF